MALTIEQDVFSLDQGIHLDVPAGDYHRLKHASASHLGAFKRSAAHARHMMDEAKASTPAMIFGTACHFAILQPTVFRALYTVADQCAGMTGKGKRCNNSGSVPRDGQWFCGIHDPNKGEFPNDTRSVMSQDDYDKCLRMAESVRSHSAARHIIQTGESVETTGIWDDVESGVRCKMRADLLCGGGIIGDLKTTQDASRDAFERSIFKFGYFRQAAHYLSGLDVLAPNTYEHFCIIAVESSAPFSVAVYRLKDDVIDAGRDEVASLLKRWAECERTGVWGGYSDKFEDISLPAWSWKQLEQVA